MDLIGERQLGDGDPGMIGADQRLPIGVNGEVGPPVVLHSMVMLDLLTFVGRGGGGTGIWWGVRTVLT
jgi:hypothetical protein